jgi:hypothetical protein
VGQRFDREVIFVGDKKGSWCGLFVYITYNFWPMVDCMVHARKTFHVDLQAEY